MESNMTKKPDQDKTKVLRLFGDISFIIVMLTCAFSMAVFALTLAQKITITVGK
jgi:hypothetical protein